MRRGDLYRVYQNSKYDPREHRVFLVVSRQELIDASFSSVVCAPIYSHYDDLDTQIDVGVEARQCRLL